MKYGELSSILNSLGFPDFYINEISKAKYQIDFGPRKGKIQFDSLRSAADKYTYETSGKYKVGIDEQLNILDSPERTTEIDLLLQCIEIFDWGGVQASNIINAINLHRRSSLKPYLIECKKWFEDETTTELGVDNVIWSSGWTKVYSFMFSFTTIYDSRVAAYMNYILLKFYSSLNSEAEKQNLKSISKMLVSFKGTEARTRCLNKNGREALGIQIKSGNHRQNFVANKVASWLLKYMCELEFGNQTQANFRSMDKAMFMLGFDINQIDKNARFQ